MGRVIEFNIAADDTERASAFYETVFDWEIAEAEGPFRYSVVSTGDEEDPGIDGRITLRAAKWQRIMCIVEVDSLDETLERVTAAGGKIIEPRTVIPGEGYMAACEDTEGNVFGIMESSEIAGF